MQILGKRCDIKNGNQCDLLPPVTLPNACASLENNPFGRTFINRITPRFRCPIEIVSLITLTKLYFNLKLVTG